MNDKLDNFCRFYAPIDGDVIIGPGWKYQLVDCNWDDGNEPKPWFELKGNGDTLEYESVKHLIKMGIDAGLVCIQRKGEIGGWELLEAHTRHGNYEWKRTEQSVRV